MIEKNFGSLQQFAKLYQFIGKQPRNRDVWHHEGVDIEDDLKNGADENVFFTCISGDYGQRREQAVLQSYCDFV